MTLSIFLKMKKSLTIFDIQKTISCQLHKLFYSLAFHSMLYGVEFITTLISEKLREPSPEN